MGTESWVTQATCVSCSHHGLRRTQGFLIGGPQPASPHRVLYWLSYRTAITSCPWATHDSQDKFHSIKGNVFDMARRGGEGRGFRWPTTAEDRVQLVPVGFVVNRLTLEQVFS